MNNLHNTAMAEISNNPQAQVEKKITEIFQKVITECLLYKGEVAEEHFKIKMDEAYENVLKNKELMNKCGLTYSEYQPFVYNIAANNINETIKTIEQQRPHRDAWGCTKYIVILFILSIGFCWAVCDIDTTRTYTWYSGISHGFFFVQHLICSLFSEKAYKACHYTSAYETWWWITTIANTSIMTLWTIGGVIYDMSFLKKNKYIYFHYNR